MSLDYPASAIPPDRRCPGCGGDGDEWTQTGEDEFTPTGECRTCGGTGIDPAPAEPGPAEADPFGWWSPGRVFVHPRHLEVIPPARRPAVLVAGHDCSIAGRVTRPPDRRYEMTGDVKPLSGEDRGTFDDRFDAAYWRARYRSAELSVVACKQRREEAEERKRAAEERADALRAEIAFARDYLGDLGHTDAFVRLHDALAADDDKRGAA